MLNHLYARSSLRLLLSFCAISVITAASISTLTSSLSLAPAQTRGRISREIVRRQFYPKVKHGSENAGQQYDVGMASEDGGPEGHYQEGIGRNPYGYRGGNLDEVEGVNRPPDPSAPTLLPILPLLNATEPQDFSTSMILPNGNEVHIEQHVDIVYNQDNVQDKAPVQPQLEESAAPHLISASISTPLAIPAMNQGKACRKPDTVTITRTERVQAVRTSTTQEIVTVTQVRTRTRTKTRTAPGAGPPPSRPTARPDVQPIPAPVPLPSLQPKPESETETPKQEPKPKPRPDTNRPPKEQPTPEPRPPPPPPVQSKEVQNENKAPAGYHSEMVKQHNKFRAEYGAEPVGHNEEFVLKGEQWLKR